MSVKKGSRQLSVFQDAGGRLRGMMQHSMDRLIGVTLIGLMLLSSQAGVAMDRSPIHIKQLGNVHAGKSPPHALPENNHTSPIVLRSTEGPPTVFYLNVLPASVWGGRYEQHLIKLFSSREGMFGRLRDIFDPFPVDAGGLMLGENSERLLDTINLKMVTADLFGDGNEQLILVRNRGGIHVYSGQKEVFDYKIPTFRLKTFNYRVDATHTARIGKRDHVFLAVNRFPYRAEGLLMRNPYTLLHISSEGIRSIGLKGFDAKKRRIIGIAAMSQSGNPKPTELLILAHDEDSYGTFHVYRYGLNGELLEEPYEYNGRLESPFEVHFAHVPDSRESVGFSLADDLLVFISPDKPAGGIREISVERTFNTQSLKERQFLGAYPGVELTLAMVRHKQGIYFLDSEGNSYGWQGDRLAAREELTPLFNLPHSDLHTLVDVLVERDGKELRLLNIEHRPQQLQPMTEEELAEAAKRYLDVYDQSRCERKFDWKMAFDAVMLNHLHSYCRRHEISCPEVHSMKDIENLMPEFYVEQLTDAHRSVNDCRRIYLVSEGQFERWNPSRKRQSGDIVDWYRSNYLQDEISVSGLNLHGQVLFSRSIQKYRPASKYYPELSLPQFRYYEQGGRHYLTGTLAQMKSDDEIAGYYLLTWE